VRSLYIAAGR